MFIGLYMISNPEIFNLRDGEKVKSGVIRSYGKLIGKWFYKIFGTETTRFE